MKKNLKNQSGKHFIIRQIQALALLPEKSIVSTYKEIKKNAIEKFGTDFDEFFEYFETYWLERYYKIHKCWDTQTLPVKKFRVFPVNVYKTNFY